MRNLCLSCQRDVRMLAGDARRNARDSQSPIRPSIRFGRKPRFSRRFLCCRRKCLVYHSSGSSWRPIYLFHLLASVTTSPTHTICDDCLTSMHSTCLRSREHSFDCSILIATKYFASNSFRISKMNKAHQIHLPASCWHAVLWSAFSFLIRSIDYGLRVVFCFTIHSLECWNVWWSAIMLKRNISLIE